MVVLGDTIVMGRSGIGREKRIMRERGGVVIADAIARANGWMQNLLRTRETVSAEDGESHAALLLDGMV